MRLKELAIKASLVLIGLLLGVIFFEFALRLIDQKDGTSFSSINEIRQTLTTEENIDTPKDPVIRSANLRSIIDPHPEDKVIYQLKPNLNLVFQGVPVKSNKYGLRGKEIVQPKPANTYRIAILGDSFTFGWGVEEDKIFPSRLEAELNSRANSNLKFEVLNFGVPGYSTFQEVHSFLDKGIDLQPDFVLVFFIQNDFGLPFFVKDVTKKSGFLASTELGRLTSKALDPRWEEHAAEISGLDPNRSLKFLSEKLKELGIPLAITFNTRKDWIKDKKRLWILKEDKSITIFNMYADFIRFIENQKIDKKDLVLPNDPHPSALRHEIWGAQLASYFLGLI